MYAIVNISGKQYKASNGTRIKVPKQVGDTGTSLTFDQVLLINDGKKTQFGSPNISGVSVTATIVEHGRNKKILVYKKKRRKGYQRKNGHRQWYTKIEFNSIDNVSVESKSTKTKLVEKNSQEEE
ncbi:MAG: 50S ribosomal protein L21 [Candidatus Marinimicrobia bacterium]|nr:50S ribosomal protein L21 [Candidatus Neomarinimicrobiota bacterium]|tara:strand:+ start:1522 stop:1896 length:375 start_codon:yes stop_codon:yes gene_type:complete